MRVEWSRLLCMWTCKVAGAMVLDSVAARVRLGFLRAGRVRVGFLNRCDTATGAEAERKARRADDTLKEFFSVLD
jgi:hypothetical protein